MATVLVVDDQLTGRRIMEVILQSIGQNINVVSYADPVAALNWAKHNPVDLVLTDFKMPNMDGIEFTQWLRKIPSCSDVPVVVITAHDDNKRVKHRALEAGATDFLGKPVDSVECRARCKNLLSLREHQSIMRDRAAWLEQQVGEKTQELRMRERETLLRLARAGEYRDTETGGHILRMACTSRIIAEGMGLDDDLCDIIEQAAPMHDIGKIGIPDVILRKSAPLSAQERKIMNEHTLIGYEILRDSPSKYLQAGAIIAWCHHERFDGTGYPRGLKGSEIPIEAAIVALADVFDALLSKRPYKQPWSMERTIAHIKQHRGRHFLPDCVDVLLDSIDRISFTREMFPSEHRA